MADTRADAAASTGPVFHAGHVLAIYLLSRLLTLGVTWGVLGTSPQGASVALLLETLASRWDAEHYLAIATVGYAHHIPVHAQDVVGLRWGFYPLWPALVRAVSAVLHSKVGPTAVVLNVPLGAAATVLAWRWFKTLLDETQAAWAVGLLCFWSHSYFYSYNYPEPLYLILLLGGLLWAPHALTWRAWAGLAAVGVALGLTKGQGMMVAAALCAAFMLPRLRTPMEAVRQVPGGAWALAAGTVVGNLWFSVGHCAAQTGVWANCNMAALHVGWGVGEGLLPAVLAGNLAQLFTAGHDGAWYGIRGWEMVCALGSLAMAWAMFVRRRQLGWFPCLWLLGPLASQLSVWLIRSVPRYLSGVTAWPLALVVVARSTSARTVVLAVSVLMHVFSAAATAAGVWLSF